MRHLFICLIICCSLCPRAFASSISLSIPKIDPSPLVANIHFTTALQITNSSNSSVFIALAVETNTSVRMVIQLQPNTVVVQYFDGVFIIPGQSVLGADAYAAVLVNGNYVFPPTPLPPPITTLEKTVSVLSSAPIGPFAFPSGPDGIKGNNGTWSSGVIQRVIGDGSDLHVVSKTAGVWKRQPLDTQWDPEGGPPKAFSIVRDPKNHDRIIVGERSDDASSEALGFSGVWQLVGGLWTFLYDPSSQTSSQGVPSLAISPGTGTLFIATSRGIARWPAPQDPTTVAKIGYPSTAAGNITAITIDSTRIWARTSGAVMHSEDDGLTWFADTLPNSVVLPEIGNIPVVYDDSAAGGNDRDSLAAFDDEAYLIFKQDSSKLTGNLLKKFGNLSPLLIYRPDQAPDKRFTAQWTRDGDGRGLGGNRFIRAYHLPCSTLTDTIGKRRLLFYVAGQGVQQAESESNGTLNFAEPIDASSINIHSDWWDFLFGVDDCKVAHQPVWVANDGGIFKGELNSEGHLTKSGWEYFGTGLYTHNINGLTAIPQLNGLPLVAYATTDNGGWYRDEKRNWHSQGEMGDANYAASDGVSPLALIWRALWGGSTNDLVIIGFGKSFPGSGGNSTEEFNLYNNTKGGVPTLDGPTHIQPIQPGLLEGVESRALDVAMLVQAPLPDKNGNPITGSDSVGNAWPQPNPPQPILIRNRAFAQHANASDDKFKGWYLVSQLPEGGIRFWTANGLADTRYYVQVDIPRCPSHLWLIEGVESECRGSNYQLLTVPEDNGISAPHGPIFVNPLEPNFLVAVYVQNKVTQVGYSRDGGMTMCNDPSLNALLTATNRFPILQAGPADTLSRMGSTYHGKTSQLIPTSVAFDRDDPTRVVVASPYGIVITAQINTDVRGGTCQQPTWLDITPALGLNAYISDVQVANGVLFIATEGQGEFELPNYQGGLLPAAWVQTNSIGTAQGPVASLRDGSGNPVPFSRASVKLTPTTGCSSMSTIGFDTRSDASGNLFPPSALPECQFVTTVSVANDGTHSSAMTKFMYTVN